MLFRPTSAFYYPHVQFWKGSGWLGWDWTVMGGISSETVISLLIYLRDVDFSQDVKVCRCCYCFCWTEQGVKCKQVLGLNEDSGQNTLPSVKRLFTSTGFTIY